MINKDTAVCCCFLQMWKRLLFKVQMLWMIIWLWKKSCRLGFLVFFRIFLNVPDASFRCKICCEIFIMWAGGKIPYIQKITFLFLWFTFIIKMFIECVLYITVSQAMLNVVPNSSATNMQSKKSMDAAEKHANGIISLPNWCVKHQYWCDES